MAWRILLLMPFFALIVTFVVLLAPPATAWLPAAVDRRRPRHPAVTLPRGHLVLRSMPSYWHWRGDGDFRDGDADAEAATAAVDFPNAIGGVCCSSSGAASAAHAYPIDQVEPDEKDTYAEAQNIASIAGPLSVLWVGSGTFTAQSGVYKNLFLVGTEVTALDLRTPEASDLRTAKTYATEHGYSLRFQQGDATKLKSLFEEGSFDVVVCSMFLCQEFDPEVVVSEIRRVLKPGSGRFGFYEHVEDIDKVIVGKVFGGERSIVRLEAYPEKLNIMAGVVRKV